MGVIFIMQETLAWVEVSKIPSPAEEIDPPQLLASNMISFSEHPLAGSLGQRSAFTGMESLEPDPHLKLAAIRILSLLN